MLYCPECGAVLSDGAQFCYRCKARIAAPIESGELPVMKGFDERYWTLDAIPEPVDEPVQICDTEPEEVSGEMCEPDETAGAPADEVPEPEYTVLPEETGAEEDEAVTDAEPEDSVFPEETDAEEEETEPDTGTEPEEISVPEESDTEEENTETGAGPEPEDVAEVTYTEEETEEDTEPEPEDTISADVPAEPETSPEEKAERELLNMLEELRPSAHKEDAAEPYDVLAALRDIPSFFDDEDIPSLTDEELFGTDGQNRYITVAEEPEVKTDDLPEADTVGDAVPAAENFMPEFFFDVKEPETDAFAGEDTLPAAPAAEDDAAPEFFFEVKEPEAGAPAGEDTLPVAPAAEDGAAPEFFFEVKEPEAETAHEETDITEAPEAVDMPMPEFFFGTEGFGTTDEEAVTEEIPEPEADIQEPLQVEDTPKTEDAAETEAPAEETEMPRFIFDEDDYDTDSFDEVEEPETRDFAERVKAVFTREDSNRDTEKEESDRSAVVRALYTRELVVDRPIRSEEVISETSDAKEARKRRRNSLIIIAALALVLSLAALYYHNLPGNVFSRRMQKAETALSNGDIVSAAAEYNKALEVRPDSLQAAEMLDSLWEKTCSDADSMAEEGRYNDAVQTAQVLKLIHPENTDGYAAKMEEIYSSWMRAAVNAGNSDDVTRILDAAKDEIGADALARLQEIADSDQVWIKYEELFSENSGKILDSFFGGDRKAVFGIISAMKEKVAAYRNEGGTFPVVSETEKSGKHVAYYYGDDGLFQVYIGKLTDENTRTGSADSFVIGTEGNKTTYEYYTCEWDKDVPGGAFTDERFGTDLEDDRHYTYSGKLKNGAYDGDIDATDWDETVYKLKFQDGKVILEMEVSPGGARNVVGWDEYRVWMLCFSDEDVQRTFTLPYVK